MQRANSLEKTLIWGKICGQEEKGATEDERLDGIPDSMDMSLRKLKEIVKDCMLEFMGSQRVGHDLVTEQQKQ